MSTDLLQELPIQPALKIGPSAVYVGDPKQLVDLLSSQGKGCAPTTRYFCRAASHDKMLTLFYSCTGRY